MAKGAHLCPRLKTEPTPELVRQEITSFLQQADKLRTRSLLQVTITVALSDTASSAGVKAWHTLTRLQIGGAFKRGHRADKQATETAMLLIALYQQRQRFIGERLALAHGQMLEPQKRQSISHCNAFLEEAQNECDLWASLGKSGRALRCLVKALRVAVPNIANLSASHRDGCDVLARIGSYLEACFYVSFCCIGHFSLPTKLLKELPERKCYKQCLTTATICSGSRLGTNAKKPSANVLSGSEQLTKWAEMGFGVYGQLFNVYKTMGFQEGLKSLLACLDSIVESNTPLITSNRCGSFILHDIYTLCMCACESRRREVTNVLDSLARKEMTSSKWRRQLEGCSAYVKQMNLPGHDASIHSLFIASRKAFMAKDPSAARAASLKCWRKLDECGTIQHMLETRRLRPRTAVKTGLSQMIVLEQASMLKRLYAKEGNLTAAEWFAKFCFLFCKEMQWHFLVGKCGMEYVKFLKERGFLAQAAKQCRRVHRSLAEELGDDYAEWLPNAPQVPLMLDHIEKTLASEMEFAFPADERRVLKSDVALPHVFVCPKQLCTGDNDYR